MPEAVAVTVMMVKDGHWVRQLVVPEVHLKVMVMVVMVLVETPTKEMNTLI